MVLPKSRERRCTQLVHVGIHTLMNCAVYVWRQAFCVPASDSAAQSSSEAVLPEGAALACEGAQ